MCICTELIEEAGKPPGIFLVYREIFCMVRTMSSLGKVHTFEDVIT